MGDRTTIGGVAYETVGSSSSNLLLRCNGTARIQWGGKLIDLIKDGKIAGTEKPEFIFEISEQDEITQDGIYVTLPEEENNPSQLFVYKNGQKYALNGVDLYISADKQQEFTVEQKNQALQNIGFYYNTLASLQESKLQNGLAYVLEDKTLYQIKDGVVSKYVVEQQTVTVERNNIVGNDITKSHSEISQPPAFSSGMITMYYSKNAVPEGWVICDGQEHVYQEVIYKTPNLSDLFKNESDEYSLIYIMKL